MIWLTQGTSGRRVTFPPGTDNFSKKMGFQSLFTRREGYPYARVTLTTGLKLALVYKQISQGGLPYHLGQLYQLCWRVSSCVTFFVTVRNFPNCLVNASCEKRICECYRVTLAPGLPSLLVNRALDTVINKTMWHLTILCIVIQLANLAASPLLCVL